MWRFFKNIVQLIISPDNGWEDIKLTSIPARAILGTLWSIAIAAISPWIKLLYNHDTSFIQLIQETIVTGVSFGLGYFLAGILMNTWIPMINGGEDIKDRITVFNSYIISLLSLQVLITSILPLSFAILTLWPLYIMIIAWRAMKFMDIEEKDAGKFMAASFVAVILPAILLNKLFYFVLYL